MGFSRDDGWSEYRWPALCPVSAGGIAVDVAASRPMGGKTVNNAESTEPRGRADGTAPMRPCAAVAFWAAPGGLRAHAGCRHCGRAGEETARNPHREPATTLRAGVLHRTTSVSWHARPFRGREPE